MDIFDFPQSFEGGIPLSEWELGKLPIGIKYEDAFIRDIEIAELDNHIDDHLTNSNLRSSRPQTWMARLVALLLKSAGPVSVREDFIAGGCKEIPKIVKEMPMHDAAYVIMQGHIANYGSEMEGVRKGCPSCQSNNLFTLDLSKLRVLDSDVTPYDGIGVMLPKGFKIDIAAKAPIAEQGETFNYLKFRLARVADAMAQERWYKPNALMSFNQRIASSCVIGIEQRNPKEPTVEGTLLSQEAKTLLGKDILGHVKGGEDRRAYRKQLSEVPRVFLAQELECNNCSEFYGVEAPYENLFPLV